LKINHLATLLGKQNPVFVPYAERRRCRKSWKSPNRKKHLFSACLLHLCHEQQELRAGTDVKI
jgi:hypothetical protein